MAVEHTQAHAFSTFPEFTHLTLDDKDTYQNYINGLPPVYDYAFTAVMTWWNPLDNMSVAELNGNLVVPYWIAGDEKHSGLSLVGTKDIDASICTIFDYLRDKGEPVRLVNVPDCVIANVQYPDMFTFKEERKYFEYIVPISRFYPLKNMPIYWRRKVNRMKNRLSDDSVVVRSVDLSTEEDRQLIMTNVQMWQSKGINDYGKVEQDSIRECVQHAAELNIDNLCLFINGTLHGFCLYTVPNDKRYISVKHVKATHESTIGFELIGYEFARYFSEQGITYVNLNADHGKLALRMFMLALGPCNFFRKYIVEPRR